MTTIGIIGLGAMGGAIGSILVKRRYAPIGYDCDASALARFAAEGGRAKPDATAVAAAADLLVLVVRDERQVEAILDARKPAAGALRSGCTVWLVSTVHPDYVSKLGEQLALAGVHLLDGPVSGGVARARVGKLTLILAGDDIAFQAVAALAPALAERVFRVGNSPGAASVIKAANQLLTASHIALTAETIGLVVRSGVDPRMFQEVVNASAGASRIFAERAPRMLDDDFAPLSTIGIFLKDLTIALDMARLHGARTPIATAAQKVFHHAAQVLGEDLGDPAIYRLYRPENEQ